MKPRYRARAVQATITQCAQRADGRQVPVSRRIAWMVECSGPDDCGELTGEFTTREEARCYARAHVHQAGRFAS